MVIGTLLEVVDKLMSDAFPSISGLLPELKLGDQDSWNRLCEKFRLGLASKTRYLCKNAKLGRSASPDDLVQETFFKAWKRHESFRGDTTAQFASWILTILRNTFLDHCRSASPEWTIGTWFGFVDQGETPSAAAISFEQEAELHACLAELTPKYQNVIVLRHFEGLKFAEIADQTNMNINTVAGIYRRGLEQLSELLDQRGNRDRSFGIDG